MMERRDFSEYLAQAARETEQALDAILPEPEAAAERQLYQAMRYSVLAGGKRLRPALFFATLDAFSAPRAPFFHFAAALEMIHTYSLIHDDLPAMDDDDLRRGQPTCHKAFDEATAILAGDALLTHAFAVMARPILQVPAERQLKALGTVSWLAGVGGMVVGQAAELALSGQPLARAMLDCIYAKKTGALFSAAVSSAAILCGASDVQLHALGCYAEKMGLAFQVIDDVLDMESTADVLGKPVGSDEKNSRYTYASLLGCDAARHAAQTAAEEAVGYLVDFDRRADMLRQFPDFFVNRIS